MIFADKRPIVADKTLIFADKLSIFADKTLISADKLSIFADKILTFTDWLSIPHTNHLFLFPSSPYHELTLCIYPDQHVIYR